MNPKVEWLLKRPRYQRVLMLVGTLVLIVGIFVWIFFLPKQEEYSRLLKQSSDLQLKLDSDRRIAANLPTFKAEYEKMLTQLDLALTELPNGREIPKLITSISSRAKGSGLDVLSFRPGSETPKGFYAEVPVSLKVEGTFHQLANFFYAVSKLPRIVNINNVKIGVKSGKGTGSNTLSVDCLAITFRFLENAPNQVGTGGR